MLRKRLTDAFVDKLALDEGRVDAMVWDSELPGFAVRVRPGSKTWMVAYRPPGTGRAGRFKRLKLGSTRLLPAAEARTMARRILGGVANGTDPIEDRRKARADVRTTLAEVLDRYERSLAQRGYVNIKTTMSELRGKLRHLLASDIREITGAQVAAVEERLRDEGKPGAAKSIKTLARAFFTWCLSTAHVIEKHPLVGYRNERATRADKVAREEHGRALSDEELATVWVAADPATAFGRLIRFLVLTGCRRGEGAGLARAMLGERPGWIMLPSLFTKQGRVHRIPSIDAIVDLLGMCPTDSRSDLLFPSWRTGQKMSGWTKLVAGIVRASGVDFDLHDLRRTFRTGLSRLGVDDDTAELAIGHAREDLQKIYNRDEAVERLRDAFERWAAHVVRLAAPR